MAERIVDHFGQDTLRVIEQEPARLVEVPGLGRKRTAMITTAGRNPQHQRRPDRADAPRMRARVSCRTDRRRL